MIAFDETGPVLTCRFNEIVRLPLDYLADVAVSSPPSAPRTPPRLPLQNYSPIFIIYPKKVPTLTKRCSLTDGDER